MAVREMKMIPDEIGVIVLNLLGLRIGIEVGDGHVVGVQLPQWNVFLFQWIVSGLFTLISAHGITSVMLYHDWIHGVQKCNP